MPQLIVKGPIYFSAGDEQAFFDWLQSISCVRSVGGHLRDIHITLKRAPNDNQLRELIALFYRYRMNMKGLAVFRTSQNAKWFDQEGKFWHSRVFARRKL
jgi:hypothetical protein